MMNATEKLLNKIEETLTLSQHLHITEQHLAEFGIVHSEELMREFEVLAARIGCNFYVCREDGTWIRAGDIVAKEGEKGYVFYQNTFSSGGVSYIENRFIWNPPVKGPLSPTKKSICADRIIGNPSPFQQWAKLNLGFHLHQADAAESALFDGELVVVEDGLWLIKWEKEPHQEIASVAEYGMWKVLQEWWDIMGRVQAMIPTRKNDGR